MATRALGVPAAESAGGCADGIARAVSALGLLLLAAACAPQNADRLGRTAAALGIDGGVEAGPTGAPSAETTVPHKLDDEERRRLADAAQRAFDSPLGTTTAYTVASSNIDIEPTAVSATPVGPAESRAAGTCRPLRLSATKGGRTTSGVLTFCRAPGSTDLRVSRSP